MQGYDLNYTGVIIGNDLQWNEDAQRLVVDPDNHFDNKGRENNPTLGKTYSDEDLLWDIFNVYSVLMTRGVVGLMCTLAIRYWRGNGPSQLRCAESEHEA